jgi:O-antigen chain-terminating methyltransferase
MAQDEIKSPQGAPEAAELLAEVEARVAEKRAQGLYDPEEVIRVEQAVASFAEARDDGTEAELMLRQANLQKLWDTKQSDFVTHRPGLMGWLVVSLKRAIHKLTKVPLSVWLSRQVRFNDELVKLVNVMAPQHAELRRRVRHNETRLDALEEFQRGARERLQYHGSRLDESDRRLAEALDDLRRKVDARIAGLERAAGSERGQVETYLAELQQTLAGLAAEGRVSEQAAEAVGQKRRAARGSGYLTFEDLHRGEREEIKQRQSVYLPLFAEGVGQGHPLVDLGCGRGEFLELCRQEGLPAKGVDLNQEMVLACRERGLEAVEADALAFLRETPAESLGGILMAQLIEHLTLDELTELVSLAASRLRPGGVLVAETINPECLTTFAGAFYLDLTHNKPIHPEAARFLWQWAGLGQVEIMRLSPYPPERRLEELPASDDELHQASARNFHRLNQLLYGYQDYAVVGRR